MMRGGKGGIPGALVAKQVKGLSRCDPGRTFAVKQSFKNSLDKLLRLSFVI